MSTNPANLWRREHAKARDGELSFPQSGLPERRVTETWNLICLVGEADMTEDLAVSIWPDFSPGVYRGDGYYIERLQIKQIGDSEHCQAVLELVFTAGPNREGSSKDPNPLRRPIEWEVDTDFQEAPAEVDGEGNQLVNTAGEQIIGLVKNDPILIFSAVRYITNIPQWLGQFAIECVNSDPVDLDGFIAAPETLKMRGVRLSLPQYTEIDGREIRYRELPLTFHYKETTWREQYLNQGMTEYFGPKPIYEVFPVFGSRLIGYTQAVRRPCLDSTGKPVEKPVPLNKDGQQIREYKNVAPPGQTPQFEWVLKELLDKSDLHFVEYLIPKKLDFNLLLT